VVKRFGFKFSFKRSACACHGALHAQCPLFAATAALTADRDRGSRAIRNHHSARIPGTGQLCLARPAVLKGCCPVRAAAEWDLSLNTTSSVNLKIIKPKYPVACSRSVGAAGERDLLLSNYAFVCGGSAGELCSACLARLRL
jgi:hypothetical protein